MTKQPTGRGLLIAEKASAMADYQAVYNKHRSSLPFTLDFEKFHGHVVQLKMPGEIKPEWQSWSLDHLPMIPDSWDYVVEKDPKRYDSVLNTIKNGNYDFIINGGDFEREGQLIQDAFFSTMPSKFKAIPIYRLWANDMTDASLFKGLNNLLLPDDNLPGAGTVRNLSQASFIRARFDWLLGLNASQVLTLKSDAKISAGRVKLPILNIIVERENNIRNFVAKPFWTLKVKFQHDNGIYEGIYQDEDEPNKPKQFFNKDDALKIANDIQNKNGVITSVSVRTVKEKAPKFFNISTLQGLAASLYGISLKDSLAALQYLYEQKILSYPRTDSSHITDELAVDIASVIKSAKLVPMLSNIPEFTDEQIAKFKKNKTYVDTTKAAAHTALMPMPGPHYDFNKLSDDQQKVLYLVSRSVMLAFMPPLVKEKTEIITNIDDLRFKTNGSILVDKGWTEYAPEQTNNDQEVPQVEEQDTVINSENELKDGLTTPPKRYNAETLLSLLENVHRLLEIDEEKIAMKKAEGLGRPSTRTSILEELKNGKMINTFGKKQEYSATDFGIEIITQIKNTPMVSPSLTARWESKLQDVELGKISSSDLYNQMVKYTDNVINQLKSMNIVIANAPDFGTGPVGTLLNGNEVREGKTGYYDSEFLEYMNEVKDANEKGLARPEMRGFWANKIWNNKKFKMKGQLSKKDVAELISGKLITKHFEWKESKSDSDVQLKLNDKNQIEFVFQKSNQKSDDIGNIAGHTVSEITGKSRTNNKTYDLYKIDGEDGYVIFKTVSGHDLTKDDLKALLTNGYIEADDFVSKKGTNFSAKLVLGADKKLSFEFNNSGSGNSATETHNISNHVVELFEGISHTTNKPYKFYKIDHSDDFVIFASISGHDITLEDISSLLTDGSFYATDFVSKKGSEYSASVILENNKLKFQF